MSRSIISKINFELGTLGDAGDAVAQRVWVDAVRTWLVSNVEPGSVREERPLTFLHYADSARAGHSL